MDVLLDTHAWAWSLTDDVRLSGPARAAIAAADAVRVSPISFFEISQKVRIGKWPEMIPHLDTLPARLIEQGGQSAAFTPEIALVSSGLDWAHRDPFDRIVAATAILSGADLVSADRAFDSLGDARLRRVW